MRMHNPAHPGLVLREYLGENPVSTAAAHLRVTRVMSRVLNGKSGISAVMALRLAAALGTSPELWMNMQSQYDLWRARQGRQPAVRKVCACRLIANCAQKANPDRFRSGNQPVQLSK
jgi:addiction module HigA family antidote